MTTTEGVDLPHVTEGQRANLAKLADYLLSTAKKEQFNMYVFLERESSVDGSFYGECELFEWLTEQNEVTAYPCGAVACAVGHGPLAGVPFLPTEHKNWPHYARLSFGASSLGYDAEKWLFSYLFASDWVDVDNTPEGAGARIRWFLTNGLPCEFVRGPGSYYPYNKDRLLCTNDARAAAGLPAIQLPENDAED